MIDFFFLKNRERREELQPMDRSNYLDPIYEKNGKIPMATINDLIHVIEGEIAVQQKIIDGLKKLPQDSPSIPILGNFDGRLCGGRRHASCTMKLMLNNMIDYVKDAVHKGYKLAPCRLNREKFDQYRLPNEADDKAIDEMVNDFIKQYNKTINNGE